MTNFWTPQQPRKNNNSKRNSKVNNFKSSNSKIGYVNFGLGTPVSFKKESIKSRKLSKYGDADMDGSPNIFDCDPRRVDKDGRFSSWVSRTAKAAVAKVKSYVAPKPTVTYRSTSYSAPSITKSYSPTGTTTTTSTPSRPTGGSSGGSSSSGGGSTTTLSSNVSYIAKDPITTTSAGETVNVSTLQQMQKYGVTTVAALQSKKDREAQQRQAEYQQRIRAQNEAFRQSELLKQRAQAAKSAEIQAALAKKVPGLTAAQKALIRKTGLTTLSQYAVKQRMAQNTRFKTLEQRKFEEKYPGYYYNESYF